MGNVVLRSITVKQISKENNDPINNYFNNLPRRQTNWSFSQQAQQETDSDSPVI